MKGFLTIAAISAALLPALVFAAGNTPEIFPTSAVYGEQVDFTYCPGGDGTNFFWTFGKNDADPGFNVGSCIAQPTYYIADVNDWSTLFYTDGGGSDEFADGAAGFTDVVITSDSTTCGGLSISLCRLTPSYIGETRLTVAATSPIYPVTIVEIPSSTAATVSHGVSGQISDAGTIKLIALVGGVPLIFYIVEQLLGLMPRKPPKQ